MIEAMPLPVFSITSVPNGLASRMHKSKLLVSFKADRGCFVNAANKKRYKGVTTTAKQTFYRDYVYKHVRPSSHVPTKTTGIRRGNQVDSEMSNWADGETNAASTPHHPYSAKLATALLKHQLIPIAGQVPVFDDDLMIATAVDMVCYSTRSKCIVLCEIKCGWNGNAYQKASGRMHSTMADFDNSPSNQHQIQLALTHYLFGVTFGTSAHESYVVRAADNGIYFYKLEEKVLRRIGPLCIAMTNNTKHHSRKKKPNNY